MENQENKIIDNNNFVKTFSSCVNGTHPIVSILSVFGIIQMLGWFYQLIIHFDYKETNILWITELGFFEFLVSVLASMGWVFAAIYYLLISVSLLYGFFYFCFVTANILSTILIRPLTKINAKIPNILGELFIGLIVGGCFGPLAIWMYSFDNDSYNTTQEEKINKRLQFHGIILANVTYLLILLYAINFV